MTNEETKIHNYIVDKLQTDDKWLKRALVRLYEYQTLNEQSSRRTAELNSVGFNSLDADFCSSVAEYIEAKGDFSPSGKQQVALRKCLPKYWRQVWNFIPSAKQQEILAGLSPTSTSEAGTFTGICLHSDGPATLNVEFPSQETPKPSEDQEENPDDIDEAVQTLGEAIKDGQDSETKRMAESEKTLTLQNAPPSDSNDAPIVSIPSALQDAMAIVSGSTSQPTSDIVVADSLPEVKQVNYPLEKIIEACEKAETSSQLKFLQPFQKEECIALVNSIANHNGEQLVAGTGTGKTYIYALAFKALELLGFFNGTKTGWMVVTFKTAVKQTQRVIKKACLKTSGYVMGYDALRSSIGEVFLTWHTEIKNGQPSFYTVWDKNFAPRVCLFDENQALKNNGTLREDVLLGYINLASANPEEKFIPVFTSATPWTRVSEMKLSVIALKPYIEYPDPYWYGKKIKSRITEDTWNRFAKSICRNPEDYNATALKRAIDTLNKYNPGLIRVVKGVRFPHRGFIKHVLMQFKTQQEFDFYKQAYEDYLRELAKINKASPGWFAAKLVAMLKFRMRAEEIKAPYLAEQAIQYIKEEKQVIVGSNFIKTVEIVSSLVESAGYKVSLIVGGQSAEKRQSNVDRFQEGKADCACVALRAGGVALSLHHDRDTSRPRVVLVPPTWSAIEMVQFLGRAVRIDSLTDTTQYICWFAGTIEEHVSSKVATKMSAIKGYVGKKETWSKAYESSNEADETEISERLITDAEETDEDGNVKEINEDEVEMILGED